MVVQILWIEIQLVSGKGIEVRDDCKILVVNWLFKVVSYLGFYCVGCFYNGEGFFQFGGGGYVVLMCYQGV